MSDLLLINNRVILLSNLIYQIQKFLDFLLYLPDCYQRFTFDKKVELT